MGLDTSHGCWHGAYSAFHTWRAELAKVAGVPPLMLMEGFYGPPDEGLLSRSRPRASAFTRTPSGAFEATRDSLMMALSDAAERGDGGRWFMWADKFLRGLPIQWSALQQRPLLILLSHSDCDGEIAAEDCGPIADDLETLLPELKGDFGGHVGDIRDKTQTFIDGLRLASRAGEPVDFH